MKNINKTFKNICNDVLNDGSEYTNERRGVTRLQIPSYKFEHNMEDGFPAIGLKKLPIKAVVGELIWFLRGDNGIKYLNDNNIKIWNDDAYNWHVKNCAESSSRPLSKWVFLEKAKQGYNFSVGQNYSVKWTNFRGVNQVQELIKGMKKDIMGSRLIVNAWDSSDLNNTALPPCHTFFQVIGVPNKGFELHWNQRSVDLFLGLPFNIASYATLGLILEKLTGYKFLRLVGDLKCVHLYDNQIELAKELVQRDDNFDKCTLEVGNITDNFNKVNISDFELKGYESHKAMRVEMLAPNKI